MRGRRAAKVRIAGEERLIAVEDAGRYRDGVGALPPPGLPDAFLEPVAHALRGLVARFARTHGPFLVEEPAARFGVPLQRVLDELRMLEVDGIVVRGAMRPGGQGEEWCDGEVLRRIRRASLARLRAEVEAVPGETLARFLPRWQGVDDGGRGGADRLRDVLVQLQGVPLPAAILEPSVLARRVPGYRPELLDALCAAGEVVWCGAGEGRVVLYFRDDAPLLGPPASALAPDGDLAEALRERMAARAARSSATS